MDRERGQLSLSDYVRQAVRAKQTAEALPAPAAEFPVACPRCLASWMTTSAALRGATSLCPTCKAETGRYE